MHGLVNFIGALCGALIVAGFLLQDRQPAKAQVVLVVAGVLLAVSFVIRGIADDLLKDKLKRKGFI